MAAEKMQRALPSRQQTIARTELIPQEHRDMPWLIGSFAILGCLICGAVIYRVRLSRQPQTQGRWQRNTGGGREAIASWLCHSYD